MLSCVRPCNMFLHPAMPEGAAIRMPTFENVETFPPLKGGFAQGGQNVPILPTGNDFIPIHDPTPEFGRQYRGRPARSIFVRFAYKLDRWSHPRSASRQARRRGACRTASRPARVR